MTARRLLGGFAALAATVLLAALSRAPQRAYGEDAGLLRLSWSGQPERIEVCRTVPEAELENLPRHMRQPVVCEGRSAEYHLTLVRDGVTLADEPVWGGGVRHDRPVYLYREFAIDPGPHHLVVKFGRTDTVRTGSDAAMARQRLDRLPPALALDTLLVVRPRAVVLVTFDPTHGNLVVRTAE